jgi:hypothetical protein
MARVVRFMMSNALMAALLLTAAACAAAGSPEVQDGDIIFHSSTSSQSEALRLAMGSPYTHMGIIFVESDGPVVLEAVGPVKRTPLAEWVKRGDEGRFVIKRLSDAQARLTSEGKQAIATPAVRTTCSLSGRMSAYTVRS